MFYIDPVYFWFVLIPTLLISIGVQIYLKRTLSNWNEVRNGQGLVGPQVAQQLFDRTSLQPIRVERVSGTMTDHFDPGANVVRLSDPVSKRNSVASMAITAHELGHVQHPVPRSSKRAASCCRRCSSARPSLTSPSCWDSGST